MHAAEPIALNLIWVSVYIKHKGWDRAASFEYFHLCVFRKLFELNQAYSIHIIHIDQITEGTFGTCLEVLL